MDVKKLTEKFFFFQFLGFYLKVQSVAYEGVGVKGNSPGV
jgi:hypothetical protein